MNIVWSKNQLLISMNKNQINDAIRKYILPSLPGYRAFENVIYTYIDSDFFVKGYHFYSKGDKEIGLKIECLFQPLYVKDDAISFTFSKTLRHKRRDGLFKTVELRYWDIRKEKQEETFKQILSMMLDFGEKYLSQFNTAEDFYKKFKSERKENIRVYEAVAYTTVLFADESLQDEMLKGLIESSLKKINRDTDWIDQIREDATRLLNAATTEARLAILQEWRKETLENLGIPKPR